MRRRNHGVSKDDGYPWREARSIVFQLPFFNRAAFQDRHEFLDRLVPFLARLPNSYKFAIEIRNRNWLDAELAGMLRDRGIALVLQDRSWMPNPAELKFDPIWLLRPYQNNCP
jgi:uncharacterized protein YecE (DUF72 family)